MHMHSAGLVPGQSSTQPFPVNTHTGPDAPLVTNLPWSAQRQHLATHTHRECHLANRLKDTPHCLLTATDHKAVYFKCYKKIFPK